MGRLFERRLLHKQATQCIFPDTFTNYIAPAVNQQYKKYCNYLSRGLCVSANYNT